MRFRIFPFVVVLAAFGLGKPDPGYGQPSEFVLRGPATSAADLPDAVFIRPPASLDDAQYREWLKTQPALILDGTVLRLGRPGAPLSLAIRVSRFELRNSAEIITNGGNLEISAPVIVSENGSVRSFSENIEAPAQDRNGVPGVRGYSGGRVTLNGALAPGSRLVVSLDGTDGGRGGQGRPGQGGAPGVPGARGADHLFDCARGGGSGGPGGQGQRGERGAPGGNGGDGGTLILQGKIALQSDQQITFSARPGAPGAGGLGGIGGPGGPGGPGGGGTTYCRGGPSGPNGAPGEYGLPGESGRAGAPGSIFANP